MKKIITLFVLLAVSSTAYSYCYWQKISEVEGIGGKKVCTWKCGYGNNARHTTTSGYICPRPR
jgi:hypothetical protein